MKSMSEIVTVCLLLARTETRKKQNLSGRSIYCRRRKISFALFATRLWRSPTVTATPCPTTSPSSWQKMGSSLSLIQFPNGWRWLRSMISVLSDSSTGKPSCAAFIKFLSLCQRSLSTLLALQLMPLPQRSDVQLSWRIADNRADRPILRSDSPGSLRRGASSVHPYVPRARLRVPRRDQVPAKLRWISKRTWPPPVPPRSVPHRLPHVNLLRSKSGGLHSSSRSTVPPSNPGGKTSGCGSKRRPDGGCQRSNINIYYWYCI